MMEMTRLMITTSKREISRLSSTSHKDSNLFNHNNKIFIPRDRDITDIDLKQLT